MTITDPNGSDCSVDVLVMDPGTCSDGCINDTTTFMQTTCIPSDTGTIVDVYPLGTGCDSVVVIHTVLTTHPPLTLIELTTCDADLVGVDTTMLPGHTGCDSMVITTTTLTSFDLEVDPAHALISPGDSVVLMLSSVEVNLLTTSINWAPNNSLSCDTCISTVASPALTTTYTATATDSAGCRAIVTAIVQIDQTAVYIPNVFSPNNDGINDEFTLYSNREVQIESVQIFNRWGGKVFERTNVDLQRFEGWNGMVQGEPAKEDVFVYQIRFRVDGDQLRILKGEIHLVR